MNVPPGDFRAQMEWLASHAEVISLGQAAGLAPGVAITFDDGYRDNLLYAAPILDELGFPATVFVVAGRVGGMLDHDTDPVTAALLTWDEVRELESIGLTIGAHTLSHRRLSGLPEEEQRREIGGCVEVLEKELGHSISAFAYPFGSAMDYTELTKRLVRESGFAFALSNRYGPNRPGTADPWALRRIWVDATDTLATFEAKVNGRLDLLAVLDSGMGIRARRLLNWALRVQ